MNVPDHVYSHHDDGVEDDIGQDDEDLDVEELMHNIVPDVLLQCRNKGFNNFEIFDKASRDLLYEKYKWCHKEHMVLWMTLELLKLDASNGWSDNSFLSLLELLSRLLQKNHACSNHCILYQKEHEFKEKCPMCNASQYKWNDDSEEDSSNNKRK
jgi:hypothetical protein